MRSQRFKRPNPALVFHLLVLLLVLASMAAGGGKQVCSSGLGLDTLGCRFESWGARVLDGGLVPGLARIAGLPDSR